MIIESEVESVYGKETENRERCGNPHPETQRLLQESEESRHALRLPPQTEEVASGTASSDLSAGCSATHTRSNSPVDAS